VIGEREEGDGPARTRNLDGIAVKGSKGRGLEEYKGPAPTWREL